MITRLMVIQKINEDGKVEVFQASSDNFQWTFESRGIQVEKDKDFFPFSIFGNVNVVKRQPGAETIVYTTEDKITFCDDYCIPSGSVIGILFPKNFIPDIIKFKDKPFMPLGLVGQVTTRPSGQIQIQYNHLEKKCAIIFNIHENICFGFKCISKKVQDSEFPQNENVIDDDLFDISLSRELLGVNAISNEDLTLINETLNHVDIVDIQQTLNELLDAVKSRQKEESKSLLNRVGILLLNGTSVTSSLTTLADSYKTGGAAYQFIARIIDYVSL